MNIYDYYAQLRGFGDRRILHELFLFMMKFDKQEKNEDYYIALYTASSIVINFPFKTDVDIFVLKKTLNERGDFFKNRNRINNKLKEQNLPTIRLDSNYYFLYTTNGNSKYDHFKIITDEVLKYYFYNRRYSDAYTILMEASLYHHINVYNEISSETTYGSNPNLFNHLCANLASDLDLILGDGGYWELEYDQLIKMIESIKNYEYSPYDEYYLPFKHFMVMALEILYENNDDNLFDLTGSLFEKWFNNDDEYSRSAKSLIRKKNNDRIIKNISQKLKISPSVFMSSDDFLVIEKKFDEYLGQLYFDKTKYQLRLTNSYNIDISKLDEKTILFLTTGDYIFEILSKQDDVDFAGAAISWCRAVENELKVIVYDAFIKSMSKNEIKEKFKLTSVQGYFSLNYFPYIIDNDNSVKLHNHLKGLNLFKSFSTKAFEEFFTNIRNLANTYRNAVSHTDSISVVDAKICHDIILITNKIMQKCIMISN